MDTKERLDALNFALSAYGKMQHNRTYALTPESKPVFGVLARAMFQRRAAEGRSDMDGKPPSSHQEFFNLAAALNQAGCNLLQRRPGDAPPSPKPWTDPVTGEQLPNPWKTKNLKGQSLLEQRDPALAAHFKAMAEDPYGTLAKMQDAEAQRQSLSSIPYSANEHQLNPFLGNNETAKAEFVKRDPDLAKFYEEEAKPVEIPIFGKNKNLTIAGKLAKDPRMAALVQLAARIHEQWLAEDKLAAQQQRAAAEEALKKLAEAAA
jgi:hypothetical protein